MKNLYSFLFAAFVFCGQGALAQVPLHNSYPSAAATIYLDFDGHYVEGTSWNVSGPIACAPANLTAAQITQVFNRVAEDYRPFNVNVTTDSARYWLAPPDKRIRVILTPTSGWYGAAGGVSFMSSFTWGDNTPAFVFTNQLNYNEKYVAEAASHEVGHTLGLRHQSYYDPNCGNKQEYNAGAGGGEIGWAPIMGVGYYRNFTLWNNGANPYGCTNYQNDLEIITKYNGFGFRPDDYGESFGGNAAKANFVNNRFTVNGVIETNTDIDVIKFSIPSFGRFKLDAVPFNLGDGYSGANLDIQVDLMTSASKVLGSYNPAATLKSSIDTMLSAGNYFLRVQGKGNMYTTEYASLGSYSLQASFGNAIILPVHKLDLQGSTEGPRHRLRWNIEADEVISSQTLEVSADGKNYQPLIQAGVQTGDYSYLPGSGSVFYYRLHVLLESGNHYYSNTITLAGSNQAWPALSGNSVRNMMVVNSPAVFQYTIVDYSGRVVSKGRLAPGRNLMPAAMPGGMYMIQYSSDQGQHTEKFMKQ